MIRVEKDFANVPDILNSDNRKEAFENNIKDEAFSHGKTLYKPDELKIRLHNIYNKKCVYCEDSLLNSPKAIEHYRPKDIYYWLAYSWDNLLLCCTSCNGAKGVNFDTRKNKVDYSNETFDNIHNLSNSYNSLEEPMLINPEKDDIIEDLIFNNQAVISSENDRVDYTIQTCNLNREELRILREEILEDFINSINKHYELFVKNGDISRFIPDIEIFINNCNKTKKFYTFRYFILKNINIFFGDIPIQKIVKSLINKQTNKNEENK